MSLNSSPSASAPISKIPLVMGFVCLAVGAVTLLYAGLTAVKSLDQSAQAQQNLQQLENNWTKIAGDSQQSFNVMRSFASSTILLTRTNLRVKLALCGVSLLTAGAGGVLLFSARPRK